MIIGITGKARTGKDTFAEFLGEAIYNKIKKRFILMAYAHELKLRVQKDFDLSYEQLWGDQKEVEDVRYRRNPLMSDSNKSYWTSREILQACGEFYRSINYNFWVEHLFRTIREKEYNNVIITDVRHPNEADPIVERGGYIIKVTSAREDVEKIHGSRHTSETAMDDYSNIDFTVNNDNDLSALRSTASSVVDFIMTTEKTKKDLEVSSNG